MPKPETSTKHNPPTYMHTHLRGVGDGAGSDVQHARLARVAQLPQQRLEQRGLPCMYIYVSVFFLFCLMPPSPPVSSLLNQ